jgi:hypothetical protein
LCVFSRIASSNSAFSALLKASVKLEPEQCF